jgi:hypothetical protein
MMYDNGTMYGWMMTGSWGVSGLLFFAIMMAMILYPVGLILRYLGYSPFWAVLTCVPGVNLIGLWVVALGLRSSNADQLKTVDPQSGG